VLNTLITAVLIAIVIGGIYYLGVVQGRYIERHRHRDREKKLTWMLNESLQRWSPWTSEIAETKAKLAAEYEEKV
jgi:membrane protein YqaA with SNARE-associated domain